MLREQEIQERRQASREQRDGHRWQPAHGFTCPPPFGDPFEPPRLDCLQPAVRVFDLAFDLCDVALQVLQPVGDVSRVRCRETSGLRCLLSVLSGFHFYFACWPNPGRESHSSEAT